VGPKKGYWKGRKPEKLCCLCQYNSLNLPLPGNGTNFPLWDPSPIKGQSTKDIPSAKIMFSLCGDLGIRFSCYNGNCGRIHSLGSAMIIQNLSIGSCKPSPSCPSSQIFKYGTLKFITHDFL